MSAADRRPASREPDALLDELGARLRAGYAAADRRSPLRRVLALLRAGGPGRGVAVLAVVLAAGGSTALATRDRGQRAPVIPTVPSQLRAAGVVGPDRATVPVYVAGGDAGGVPWRLSASACSYGAVRVVSVFLEVPGGGGGTRCDVAARRPGRAPTPSALAARRVQSYYDPVADRTWVFGVVPAGARSVAVRAGAATATAAAVPLEAVSAHAAGLPAGLRRVVVALPGAHGSYAADVRGATGDPILHCVPGRCS